jgi:hypothetical protein
VRVCACVPARGAWVRCPARWLARWPGAGGCVVLGRGPGSRLLPVRACPLSFTVPPGKAAHGRLPERPKGAVCKTVGLAYVGSNPTPATTSQNDPWPARMRPGTGVVPVRLCPAGSGLLRASTENTRRSFGACSGLCDRSRRHARAGCKVASRPLEVTLLPQAPCLCGGRRRAVPLRSAGGRSCRVLRCIWRRPGVGR